MKPEEFQGGTLTVSNLGSYGIDSFSAIINPPQAIILSIGAIVKQPVLNADAEVVPGYRMKIGMSCDHRVVDGAIGANHQKARRQLLEIPSLLLCSPLRSSQRPPRRRARPGTPTPTTGATPAMNTPKPGTTKSSNDGGGEGPVRWAGVDWSWSEHAVCVIDDTGAAVSLAFPIG